MIDQKRSREKLVNDYRDQAYGLVLYPSCIPHGQSSTLSKYARRECCRYFYDCGDGGRHQEHVISPGIVVLPPGTNDPKAFWIFDNHA